MRKMRYEHKEGGGKGMRTKQRESKSKSKIEGKKRDER